MQAEAKSYKGHNITVEYQNDPSSPRENDNICVFHIGHSRYAFGDKNYQDRQGIDDAFQKAKKAGDIVLPLYIYDHSGITISLSPFSCPWDSGQVGFIQVPKKTMIKEFGKKNFTKALRAKALDWAKMEVEEMDGFVRGEVFGYIVDGDKDHEHSCWGYYSIEDAMDEAEGIINWIVADETKKHHEQIKTWIKNKVPYRNRHSLQKALSIN